MTAEELRAEVDDYVKECRTIAKLPRKWALSRAPEHAEKAWALTWQLEPADAERVISAMATMTQSIAQKQLSWIREENEARRAEGGGR